MFPFLCFRAVSLEPLYSLFSPFNRTDISEIGNWSLRGSAVSWKNVIRLTSDSLATEWGAVCQRAPTAFVDWSIEIEISARGKGAGGGAISFVYSEDVCPEKPAKFNGFRVTINTSQTDSSEYSPVYFSEGSFENGKEYGKLKIRNQNYPLRVRIVRSEGSVCVESTTYMRFETLFEVELKTKIPDFGYFTVAAETDFEHSDNNDLYLIRTRAQTEVAYERISQEVLVNNRKILESDALKRREAKKARREALLPAMHRYLEVRAANNDDLSVSSGRPDMSDAFELVKEAAKRGMDGVTIDMLKVFINRYLQDTLAKAGKKVNLALDSFDDTRGDVGEMWTYLRAQLLDLAGETRRALTILAEEALESARQVQLDHWARHVGPSFVERSANAYGSPGKMPMVLIIVMLFELVAYVIFFIKQHSKTHGFKKVD
jgi:hypothetical protein